MTEAFQARTKKDMSGGGPNIKIFFGFGHHILQRREGAVLVS